MRPLLLAALCITASCAADYDFDYYLLALSWSPQYCSSPQGARDDLQCNGRKQFNFVVHGLWPQHEKGYPADCPTSERPSRAIVDKMLDIMPSPRLVRHEWEKHGACSGKSPAQYFARVRSAWNNVKIPPAFARPQQARRVPPAQIRNEFLAANPGLPAGALTVHCGGGRFLSEVRLCLTKDLKPRPCSSDVARQQCRAPEVIVQPLR
jgi:ribonuclease T2